MTADRSQQLCTALFAGITVLGVAVAAQAAGPAGPSDPHRGGTLRLMSTAGAGTIDPQVNYTLQYAQVEQAIYDGLVAFKKAPGPEAYELMPDLAEAIPKPDNAGKTYVFKLRKGIHFSDGREVTLTDAVASFQRIFKVLGPTAGSFYNGIVGADLCLRKPATCTLAGGVVADVKAGTLTINLVRPDREFLYKLSVPHAVILPADAPARDVGVTPIPGTGPYKIVAYDPKKQLKLTRNSFFKVWSEGAQPEGYADEVDYDFGLSDEDQVTAIANGQGDFMFNPLPADRLGEVGGKYAKQVHISPMTAVYYLPMNTRLAPFDNPKARQAVNYAIDRNALVKLYGGPNTASPTCQVLPPRFPGYKPYCPYTLNPGTAWTAPDLARARLLVKESGTAGTKVTLVAQDIAADKQLGTYLQSVLSDLGYPTTLRLLSNAVQFTYIQNTNNKVQISLSTWYQDYPAAADFLDVLFSCASFHPGSDASINISGLCDKDLDEDLAKAKASGIADPAVADAQWSAIDRKVVDLAPAAMLFNLKQIDFVSKRVGNYTFSGEFNFLFQLAWVH